MHERSILRNRLSLRPALLCLLPLLATALNCAGQLYPDRPQIYTFGVYFGELSALRAPRALSTHRLAMVGSHLCNG